MGADGTVVLFSFPSNIRGKVKWHFCRTIFCKTVIINCSSTVLCLLNTWLKKKKKKRKEILWNVLYLSQGSFFLFFFLSFFSFFFFFFCKWQRAAKWAVPEGENISWVAPKNLWSGWRTSVLQYHSDLYGRVAYCWELSTRGCPPLQQSAINHTSTLELYYHTRSGV